MAAAEPSLTQLLREARQGDRAASEQAYAHIYRWLHDAARAQLRRGAEHATLTPTALVHEAWLKLSSADFEINDRQHYLAMASAAMRHLVVDAARARKSEKRGGQLVRVTLPDDGVPASANEVDVLSLDAALGQLEALEPRLASVVQYRFFGGLTEVEIANVLGTTERTVRRDWRKARAFLHRALSEAA
ncbi:MAG: ECF-type sigma factor [Myxococcaceae bacterium]|jgi:RNA polymerase sigma factor (TIGR02999 family)|nr:ECF-type sigma factor [Myxococcaceae bacterium]